MHLSAKLPTNITTSNRLFPHTNTKLYCQSLALLDGENEFLLNEVNLHFDQVATQKPD